MPKPTIKYILWSSINRIAYRISIISSKVYWYTNKRALIHSPAMKWLFAGFYSIH